MAKSGGCGADCARLLLILFNIVFLLSGMALFAIGVWMLVDNNITQYFDILEVVGSSVSLLKYTSYALIALGIFVFFVGAVGFYGAIKYSLCALGMYIFFLFIVMAGELAAGILIVVKRGEIQARIKSDWENAIRIKYGTDCDPDVTKAIDAFQQQLKCCGVKDGWKDYMYSRFTNTTGQSTPTTCCVLRDDAKDDGRYTTSDTLDYNLCKLHNDPAYYHDKACFDATTDWLNEHSTILIGVGVGIACLELFGFIFAIMLCRCRRK